MTTIVLFKLDFEDTRDYQSVREHALYRDGPTMFARKVMLRTRHACHIQNKRDQVCLPYKFFWGLDMLAMLGILGTRYACHVVKK